MSAPRTSEGGFSLPELMVVLALGVLVVFALQQAVVSQRRFYTAQQDVVRRHETTRVALAVLTAALREANLTRGDAVVTGPGTVRVRMPLGAGFACGADAAGQRVGLTVLEGRWASGVGDSVLVLGSGGWTAEAVAALEGAAPQVPCVPAGGTVVRLARAVPGVVPGSAMRAFRSHVLEVREAGGMPWLARRDGDAVDLLAGPLASVGGFRAWYVDSAGAVTANVAQAARVGVSVVTGPRPGSVPWGSRQDTLVMTLGGRNP